ncbi:MAG: hypothetical protein HPY55_08870 [Firmicutes bacterium]|nr:hypothetical protein [Bacillota bacterium]
MDVNSERRTAQPGSAWSGLVNDLRGQAAELLASGCVSVVIGYANGWDPSRPVPYFARSPAQAQDLVFDSRCALSLVKYVLDWIPGARRTAASRRAAAPAGSAAGDRAGAAVTKVAVVLKGCDALGLRRLIMDRRVSRDAVYAIGVRCNGVQSPDAQCGVLLPKCTGCESFEPADCDIVLGIPADPATFGKRDLSKVDEFEASTADSRYAFWARQMRRCIRCYACRNVCPACHCRECSLEPSKGPWLTRERDVPEQAMFQFARAFHVAGRCVDCGECERVCPVGIPLALLNRKAMRDIKHLFGVERPGVPGETEPLGRFSQDDPEEFM